jgi:2-oxo-3-hexenedioate decarboxylase
MTLSEAEVTAAATRLRTARLEGVRIPALSLAYPGLTEADAYRVQAALELLEGEGALARGYKMGLTSRVKMRQVNVDKPIRGFFHASQVLTGPDVKVAPERVHPRAEPEICFVMREALRGVSTTREQALAAIDFVVGAVEVLDSRYEAFKFDLPSVIADNASASAVLFGTRRFSPRTLDLRLESVRVLRNGQTAQLGAGAAVLDDPVQSLVTLVHMLAAVDRHVPAGAWVMTGGLTEAVPFSTGDLLEFRFGSLGDVVVRGT